MKPLVIAYIYPELLNLYGDMGNVVALQRRLEWRNLPVDVRFISVGDAIDFTEIDIVYLGGAADHEQGIAARELQKVQDELRVFAADAGVIFAVCGSYHMLGNTFCLNGQTVDGLGLVNIDTVCSSTKYVGNAWMHTTEDTGSQILVGFVNHGTTTTYGEGAQALGSCFGPAYAHNKQQIPEGVVSSGIIGTNFHGPLLPRNPKLADYLIELAYKRRGEVVQLQRLENDILEEKAASTLWERFDAGKYYDAK